MNVEQAEPVQIKMRTKVGTVVSDKMDKTIVVSLSRRVKHPLYGKYMTKSTKLKVHDEQSVAKSGDTVSIAESRPLSKNKTWRLVEVLEKAPV